MRLTRTLAWPREGSGGTLFRVLVQPAPGAGLALDAGAGPEPSLLAASRLHGGWMVDAHQIAGRVTHGTVPRAPRLLGRFLHDLGARRAHLLGRGLEVVGVEVDAVQGALGDEGSDRVVVGGAAAQVVGEDDRDVGLGGGADSDPAEAFAGDVVAQFEAEFVAVEGQREVGVSD